MNTKQFTDLLDQATQSGQLDLCGHHLTTWPESIFALQNLQGLYMDDNHLTTLPPNIAHLTQLKVLSLTGNQLTTLPPEIAQLQNLEWLYLANNQLTELPPAIAELKLLKVLSLASNQLTTLPKEITTLSGLKVLALDNNPLTSPPPEIIAQGTQAILTYLQQSLDGSSQWLAKLVIVGEAGVGKSTLLEVLQGKPVPVQLDPTPGIEVKTWLLAHPSQTNVTMHLKTWDFGGQTIYHATHQFFLTNRALFILVWNARLGFEQGKLYYWLNTIQARAPESPIMLVATHIDEGYEAKLPWADLKRKYPQLVGTDTHKVSSIKGTGITDLASTIATEVAKLPLMGEIWPTHWLAATDAIRARNERYLTPHQLQVVLSDQGLTKEEGVILSKWLHQLGDLLYFQEDDLLKQWVILQPQWVTEHLSRVLTSPVVTANRGLLTLTHLQELWNDLDSPLQAHFLNLMENFDLSYRIADSRDVSLVVECLPLDPPPNFLHEWETLKQAKEVSITYQLNTLPPGIPTWFIARSHRFSTQTHWRYGALLKDRQHLGLIQAYPDEKMLKLTVRGPYPHNFLTVLRDGLELTLQRYPGLSIIRKVPCVGHHGQPCTHEFDVAMLETALAKNKQEVECQHTFEPVRITELLFGLDWHTQEAVLQKIEDLKEEEGPVAEAQIRNLIELNQRQLYNRLIHDPYQPQGWQCPYCFTLDTQDANWWRKIFTVKEVKLQLYCQGFGSDAPHPLEEDGCYTIAEFRHWLPLLPALILIVNAVVTYGLGTILPNKPFIKKEEELKFLKKLSKEFPLDKIDEATLRSLCELLKELDPLKQWGGLERVVTPEGQVLWLCQHHVKEYKQQNR